MTQSPLPLKANDCVEIIAPSSKPDRSRLEHLRALFAAHQLSVHIPENLIGPDALCANTDSVRFELLKNALYHPNTKALVAVAGGYGCTRLIPHLINLPKPPQAKLLIGMSDLTALHLFLNQHWGWPSLHAAAITQRFCEKSISALMNLLTQPTLQLSYSHLEPLNAPARHLTYLEGSVSGGNLCLLQASIGTAIQFDPLDKFILLEEVNERAYRIDRMLQHLKQAGLFNGAKAILLGDFIGGSEPDGTELTPIILKNFAEAIAIPVLKIAEVGHGKTNYPILLGTKATLQQTDKLHLTIQTQ